ncbi:MAG TPA: DUF4139 domain-containing protein [Pirellulales bacterium]|nr:DUF4139 domain-containing protein [Pirellulales bacterium]
MKSEFLVVLAVLGFGVGTANGQPRLQVPGALVKVRLFDKLAVVAREISVPGPVGAREVLVPGLPKQILPNSLYAEDIVGTEVRGVRIEAQPAADNPHAATAQLDIQLQDLAELLRTNERSRQAVQAENRLLANIEGFVLAPRTVRLSQRILGLDRLEEFVDFMREARDRAVQRAAVLEHERNQLLRSHAEINQHRAQAASQAPPDTVQRAVVVLNLTANPGRFRLWYMVDNVSWSLAHRIDARIGLGTLRLQSLAVINQNSGEDWADVELTLSSGAPLLLSAAPQLPALQDNRFAIDAHMTESKAQDYVNAAIKERNLSKAAGPATNSIIGTIPRMEPFPLDALTAQRANQLQTLERHSPELPAPRAAQVPGHTTWAPAADHSLGRITVPARSMAQNFDFNRAQTLTISADHRTAIPLLSSVVYREAVVKNNSNLLLLPGPTVVFLDGNFAGQGWIEGVPPRESFVVGLGVDPLLRAKREFLGNTASRVGNQTVVTGKYRLTIENSGSTRRTVLVRDRVPDRAIPFMTQGSNPRQPTSPPQPPAGLWEWDIDVPAQAIGTHAETREYTVTQRTY